MVFNASFIFYFLLFIFLLLYFTLSSLRFILSKASSRVNRVSFQLVSNYCSCFVLYFCSYSRFLLLFCSLFVRFSKIQMSSSFITRWWLSPELDWWPLRGASYLSWPPSPMTGTNTGSFKVSRWKNNAHNILLITNVTNWQQILYFRFLESINIFLTIFLYSYFYQYLHIFL